MTLRQLIDQWRADAKTLPQWGAEGAREFKRRLDADRMNVTALVAYVLGTALEDLRPLAQRYSYSGPLAPDVLRELAFCWSEMVAWRVRKDPERPATAI